jgi:hypothetical protein
MHVWFITQDPGTDEGCVDTGTAIVCPVAGAREEQSRWTRSHQVSFCSTAQRCACQGSRGAGTMPFSDDLEPPGVCRLMGQSVRKVGVVGYRVTTAFLLGDQD